MKKCFGYSDNLDYSLFIIWNNALEKEEEIIKYIDEKFNIIFNCLIYWSDEFYNENIKRFYSKVNADATAVSAIHKKIGKMPFRLIVVSDENPIYRFRKSVSGVYEIVNLNIFDSKNELRARCAQKFQIHASNNFNEFKFQMSLLLGVDDTISIINRKKENVKLIKKDLEGHSGWKNYNELFKLINYTQNYMILRDFYDFKNENYNIGDIDFLTDDYQNLASLMNVKQTTDRPYKGTISVKQKSIKVDIRHISDNYFDERWQINALSNRVKFLNTYVPNWVDLFFIDLYHVMIHKNKLTDRHINRLKNHANNAFVDDIDFNFRTELRFDLLIVLYLYLSTNNYLITYPNDRGIGLNLINFIFIRHCKFINRNNLLKYLFKNLLLK